MLRQGIALFASLVALLSPICHAQSTPNETLLALSKRDHTLAIVDPVKLTVVGKVPVGNDPHEVIASSDGTTAYVSNYGGGAFNTLAVIDLAAQKPLPEIDLGALRGPHGLIFVGGKLYFTAEAAKAIGSYDPATKKIDWIFGTGQNRTHMVYVFDDLKRIVTTNVSSGTVSFIEKTAGRPMGSPPPGMAPPPGAAPGPRGPMGPPNGKEMWVANAQDGTISIIDLALKKVTATLNVNARGANRLKFTPDGSHVFVSMLGGPDLLILDAASHQEIKRIPVGHGAAGILMQPDGSRAFVACTPDSYVALIDLKTLTVTGHLDVGPEPDGLAWSVKH
jgi:YVTN family beta-propeller protein